MNSRCDDGVAGHDGQAKLAQPFGEGRQQVPCVVFVLASDHPVISVPNDHDLAVRLPLTLLMDPEIDDVVQEQIGEDRAAARPFRGSYLSRLPLSALQDACREPPSPGWSPVR
jgi:hypothetical protein